MENSETNLFSMFALEKARSIAGTETVAKQVKIQTQRTILQNG